MKFTSVSKLYYSPEASVTVEIGQHFMVDGLKGHATNLGRKYVEVLLYPGQGAKKARVKVNPLVNRPLDTRHH